MTWLPLPSNAGRRMSWPPHREWIDVSVAHGPDRCYDPAEPRSLRFAAGASRACVTTTKAGTVHSCWNLCWRRRNADEPLGPAFGHVAGCCFARCEFHPEWRRARVQRQPCRPRKTAGRPWPRELRTRGRAERHDSTSLPLLWLLCSRQLRLRTVQCRAHADLDNDGSPLHDVLDAFDRRITACHCCEFSCSCPGRHRLPVRQ